MIEALQDTVIVEPIDESKLPPSHITLPDRARDTNIFGWVRFVGPDVKALKPGDTVVLPSWNDDKIEVDSVEYIIFAEKSINVRVA